MKRQRTQKRNVLKDVPQDIVRHVNEFLGPDDTLSEVSNYFYDTVDPHHCIRKTEYGLACAKNITKLHINSQCFGFCGRHFDKIAAQLFNMIAREMTVIDVHGQTSQMSLQSITATDQDNIRQWSASVTYDPFMGHGIGFHDYPTNRDYSLAYGYQMGQYLKKLNWKLSYKNMQFKVVYRTERVVDGMREVFGTWENNVSVPLNPTNFSQHPQSNNHILFAFEIENVAKEEIQEEKEEVEEEKQINCKEQTRNGMTCTSNLFDTTDPKCESYCQDNALDGVTRLIDLIINNPLFVEVLERGSIFAYQLTRDWSLIMLGLEEDDILLETTSDLGVVDTLIHENNWSKVLIGFRKSEAHMGITKLYVRTTEDVIRLTGFAEDQSHVILSIQNPFFIMNQPD